MEKEQVHPFTQKLLETNPAFSIFPLREKGATRPRLPGDSMLTERSMIWAILKDNIGKDLWSITMPVTFNEPLSLLQRINEHLEYQENLRMANKCMDQYMRLAYVFANSFMVLSNTVKRVNKTFNPLLGETYEYIDKDLRSIIEQVSHHPPISAFHAESKDFILTGHIMFNTELSLTSFKMVPTGETTVILKSTGEAFKVTLPKMPIYNYIVGKMYLWHEGPMECINLETKEKLEVIFKKKGWTSKGDYLVDGFIFDENGKEVYQVEGNWKESLHIIDSTSKEITKICQRKPDPVDSDKQYCFSDFAIQANYLPLEIFDKLPPTDCRFRPDMRAYEYGNVDLASKEKFRLEEKQRARRKETKEKNEVWKPLWFDLEMNESGVKTKFKGEYWKAKESGKWPIEMLDLYN